MTQIFSDLIRGSHQLLSQVGGSVSTSVAYILTAPLTETLVIRLEEDTAHSITAGTRITFGGFIYEVEENTTAFGLVAGSDPVRYSINLTVEVDASFVLANPTLFAEDAAGTISESAAGEANEDVDVFAESITSRGLFRNLGQLGFSNQATLLSDLVTANSITQEQSDDIEIFFEQSSRPNILILFAIDDGISSYTNVDVDGEINTVIQTTPLTAEQYTGFVREALNSQPDIFWFAVENKTADVIEAIAEDIEGSGFRYAPLTNDVEILTANPADQLDADRDIVTIIRDANRINTLIPIYTPITSERTDLAVLGQVSGFDITTQPTLWHETILTNVQPLNLLITASQLVVLRAKNASYIYRIANRNKFLGGWMNGGSDGFDAGDTLQYVSGLIFSAIETLKVRLAQTGDKIFSNEEGIASVQDTVEVELISALESDHISSYVNDWGVVSVLEGRTRLTPNELSIVINGQVRIIEFNILGTVV